MCSDSPGSAFKKLKLAMTAATGFFDLLDVQLGQLAFARPQPQQVAHAQHQLARIDGLGEELVGADVEPFDARGQVGARGDEDDR
jgi:hypothetical protein